MNYESRFSDPYFKRKFYIVIGALLLLIGGIISYKTVSSVITFQSDLRNDRIILVEAEVMSYSKRVELVSTRWERSSETVCTLSVDFTYNGKEYHNISDECLKNSVSEGDILNIYVSSSNPGKLMYPEKVSSFGYAVLILPLIGATMITVTLIKNKYL